MLLTIIKSISVSFTLILGVGVIAFFSYIEKSILDILFILTLAALLGIEFVFRKALAAIGQGLLQKNVLDYVSSELQEATGFITETFALLLSLLVLTLHGGLNALAMKYLLPANVAFLISLLILGIGTFRKLTAPPAPPVALPPAIQPPQSIEELWQLPSTEFANLVPRVLATLGYQVTRLGGGSLSGLFWSGKDPISGTFFVRGVHGPAGTVAELEEITEAIRRNNNEGWGLALTSGYFDTEARAYAAEHGIKILDGDRFLEVVQQEKLVPGKKPAPLQAAVSKLTVNEGVKLNIDFKVK